ncbi:hypothetical protein Tco_1225174 [Tanacetum coccineum]
MVSAGLKLKYNNRVVLLDVEGAKVVNVACGSDPKFPPGFTPLYSDHLEEVAANSPTSDRASVDHTSVQDKGVDNTISSNDGVNDFVLKDNPSNSTNHVSSSTNHDHVDSMTQATKPVNGFSILERFQDFITIGQAMGYGMKRCEKDYQKVIASMGDLNGWLLTLMCKGLVEREKRLGEVALPLSSKKKSVKEHDLKLLHDAIIDIDSRLDKGTPSIDDMSNRVKYFHDLQVLEKNDSVDLAQKAKIKWAIEGDENTKLYHGIVKKKTRHLAIKGVLVDSDWLDSPSRVKAEFYSHFAKRFSTPDWTRASFDA